LRIGGKAVRKGEARLGFPSARHSRLLRFLAATLAAAALGALAPADAQTGSYRSADRKKPALKAATGPVLAVVSLARQRIWVHDATGLIAQSAVSTGQAGHTTPTGVFSVVQKKRFHRSNIYSAAPMPYMQRITWSGVALHAGVVPGYPASHGCIRLPQQFAVELWGITRVGARVVIVPDNASVLDIEHPRLPAPVMASAPRDHGPAQQQAKAETGQPAGRTTDIVDVAYIKPSDEAPPPAKLLNPLERAKIARQRAIADAASTAKATKAAAVTSAAKATEANAAIAALRGAELALTTARARRDAAATTMDKAAEAEAMKRAGDLLVQAESKVAEAEKAVEQARVVEASKTPEALAAAKAVRSAEQASEEAAARLKATERNTEPISIFVSRKAGRIFIRQAWAPIHEAPVTFKESELPLGTHTYLAAASDDGGRNLRWISVSLPPSRPVQPRQEARRAAQSSPAPPAAAAIAHRPETAASVLERFELAEETRSFIEDRLWTGASLIVSDEGISPETGATTDFIVVTR
jgi:hypothetical protein